MPSAIWTSTASGNWGTNGNWNIGAPASGAGETANFTSAGIASDITVTLAGTSVTIGNINVNDSDGGNSLYTIARTSGAILTLDNNENSPVITTTTRATISAVIAGLNGFTKQGANQLTLTGTNTISGSLVVAAGTLFLGEGAGGSITNITTISLTGTLTVNASTATISATVSGTGALTKGATTVGALTLTGDGTNHTGNMSVSNGSIVFSPAVSSTWGSYLTASSSYTFSKTGAGTTTLTGGGNTAAAFSITGGTLVFAGPFVTGTGAVTISSGATLALSGTGNLAAQTLPTFSSGTCFSLRNGASFARAISVAGTGVSSSGAFNADGSSTSYSSTLTISGASATLRVESNGTHTFSGTLAMSTATTTIQTDSGAKFVLTATSALTGTGGVTKTGAGALRLVGAQLAVTAATITVSEGTVETATATDGTRPSIGRNLSFATGTTFKFAA